MTKDFGCTKLNGPTDPDRGQNFDPVIECPDRLITHGHKTGTNSSMITIKCDNSCPHHKDYKGI